MAFSAEDLAAALKAEGVALSAREIDARLEAVNAAPPLERHVWTRVFAPALSERTAALLDERRHALAADAAEEPPRAERLAALRREMQRRGLDGFILQRTDAHGSEYLPAAEERLAWLSGFTGSAGELVVLRDAAAVFVDGRYTVQAEAELDPSHFEHCHLVEKPPARWLEDRLEPGMRIGFDPFLTRRAQKQRLEKTARARRAELVPVDGNPVDAVWPTRPPPPLAPILRLDERYAGESCLSKRERMGREVETKGADHLVLTAADSIAWLLNIRGHDIAYNPLCLSHLVLAKDGSCRWFVDPRKIPADLGFEAGIAIEPIAGFLEALDRLGEASVLVDPSLTHEGFIARLEKAGANVIEADDPVYRAKAEKNEAEIAGTIAAHKRDGAAMVRFLAWLDAQPQDGSLSERDLAQALLEERRKDPLFRGPSFETVTAHGPNAALPHYRATPESDRPITQGTVYLVDSGAHYEDGTTDITRTVALGRVDQAMCKRFTLVLKGHIALAEAVFPKGTTGAQLDTLARQHLWRQGLDYDHGTGHGVGHYLCVHEGPQRIAKSGGVALSPGMLISNEPGYYEADAYGIRTENLVLVQRIEAPEGAMRELLGFRTITLAPIDRRLIDVTMLERDERIWVDAYHARVQDELAPLLDGDSNRWLARACAPL